MSHDDMRLIVLGSGNWGMALALLFSEKSRVYLWAKDAQEALAARENLKQSELGNKTNVFVEVKYARPLSAEDIVIVAIPSGALPVVAEELSCFIRDCPLTVISVSKGLIQPGFKTISQVLREKLPQCHIGIITGPTIASEIMASKPAKAVLAAQDVECLLRVKSVLQNQLLHFELSLNVKEAEFCASLKGIIAIAAGIAVGLGHGKNFMGLLLTYGVHEILAIGKFLGISTDQILSIAGLGDLIATCLSEDSRNHRFGVLMAQNKTTEEALKEVGMIVEGVRGAQDITALATLNLSLPLIYSIAQVIQQSTEESLKNFVNTVLDYRGTL
jgi:glycerol-3-phosphate dehydrogenase (NAD(P)+)